MLDRCFALAHSWRLKSADEALDPVGRGADVVEGGRIATPQEPLARGTKGAARHAGDTFLLQQLHRKFLARQAGATDVREHIKRTTGKVAIQPDFIEAFHEEIAPLVVAVAHLDHRRLPVFQRLDRGVLTHDRRAEHRVLVDLHHRLDDRLRCARVAKPESGHGEGFGKSVQ